MALDLAETIAQIDALAGRLDHDREDRARRLGLALRAMSEADSQNVRHKVESSRGRPYLCAGIEEGLAVAYAPPSTPASFSVASVDGSHIDVDRHLPARCYLINLGGCLLTYGSASDALLFSNPRLYSRQDELYLSSGDPESRETAAVEGPLLGLVRTVEEVKGLADLLDGSPADLPTLGLLDGSLVLWGLSGRGYPPFVRDRILADGLVPALDQIREMAGRRALAVAAYISLPQSTEVVNTLRLHLCQADDAQCRSRCSIYASGQPPCDTLNGFLDRHLFQELLGPGQRSCVFRTNSSIPRDHYGPHAVCFFYLNTGDEIARVEVPRWVAAPGPEAAPRSVTVDNGLLGLTHSLIVDQCRLGMGYPVAISESHEQAVVAGADRASFRRMLGDALESRGLPSYTSEKSRSKRAPWL